MHLEKLASELQFVSSSSDTKEEQDFCERMKQYKLTQQGAGIFIYNRDALAQANATEVKPEPFSRDRAFPLIIAHETNNSYNTVNLEQLLAIH